MFKTPPRHSIHIHPDLIKVIGGDRKNTLGGGRSTSSRQKPPGKTGASKTKWFPTTAGTKGIATTVE